jgi:hypothetical protein
MRLCHFKPSANPGRPIHDAHPLFAAGPAPAPNLDDACDRRQQKPTPGNPPYATRVDPLLENGNTRSLGVANRPGRAISTSYALGVSTSDDNGSDNVVITSFKLLDISSAGVGGNSPRAISG